MAPDAPLLGLRDGRARHFRVLPFCHRWPAGGEHTTGQRAAARAGARAGGFRWFVARGRHSPTFAYFADSRRRSQSEPGRKGKKPTYSLRGFSVRAAANAPTFGLSAFCHFCPADRLRAGFAVLLPRRRAGGRLSLFRGFVTAPPGRAGGQLLPLPGPAPGSAWRIRVGMVGLVSASTAMASAGAADQEPGAQGLGVRGRWPR